MRTLGLASVAGVSLLLAVGLASGCGSAPTPPLVSSAGGAGGAGAMSCQRTSDCSADRVCSPDGRCVNCYSDKDCRADQHCAQELCIETVDCSSATDCSSDQTCTAGQCEPVIACTSASDCSAGYVCCVSRACVAFAVPSCCDTGEAAFGAGTGGEATGGTYPGSGCAQTGGGSSGAQAGGGGGGAQAGGGMSASGSGSAGATGGSGGASCGLVIDDMEGDNGLICQGEGRIGHWYTFNDQSPGTSQTPAQGTIPTLPDLVVPIRGTSHYAMHTVATLNTYAAIGCSLNGTETGVPEIEKAYDVSGYSGISFYAKGTPATVEVILETLETQFVPGGGTCAASCAGNHALVSLSSTAWTQYKIPLTSAEFQGGSAPLMLQHASAVEFLVYNGGAAPLNADFWIDDLSFY